MKEINNTQKAIYDYLCEKAQDGIPPSVREIGAAVGLSSTSSVHANLKKLEEAGYIERDPLLKRSIRICGYNTDTSFIRVPLIGTVTAGMPILAVEQIDGFIPYAGKVSADKPLFALKVRGDSMINAGILDDDIIIAEKTNTCDDGDIVVAMIEDEATVKRLYREKDGIRLQPENDAYPPIFSQNVSVVGKVVSLMRYYY